MNSSKVDSEPYWLISEMNRTGLSNQDVFDRLTIAGWRGAINNISNWRNGSAQIPLEVVPLLVSAFGRDPLEEGLPDVVHLLQLRFPSLVPYFKDVPRKVASRRMPRPVYMSRRGNQRGRKFVPYKDVAGNYVAGTSRFEQDKQLFPSIQKLIEALKANPELRVRMVLEDAPRSAPSLIRQASLTWE